MTTCPHCGFERPTCLCTLRDRFNAIHAEYHRPKRKVQRFLRRLRESLTTS